MEGNTGTSPSTPFTFVVTLSNPPGIGTNTVDYHTSNGSAASGSDYVGKSGSLEFGADETAKMVSVLVSATVRSSRTRHSV